MYCGSLCLSLPPPQGWLRFKSVCLQLEDVCATCLSAEGQLRITKQLNLRTIGLILFVCSTYIHTYTTYTDKASIAAFSNCQS